MFASQHSDRLSGLVYLDGASDPTTPPYDPPLPDPATVPRPLKPTPEPDRSSFEALTKRPGLRITFPEAEWRQQFAENPDGSVGQSLLNVTIRQAITVDARVKPNYSGYEFRCWPCTRRNARSRKLPPSTISATSRGTAL
jgi:hypothetical protein